MKKVYSILEYIAKIYHTIYFTFIIFKVVILDSGYLDEKQRTKACIRYIPVNELQMYSSSTNFLYLFYYFSYFSYLLSTNLAGIISLKEIMQEHDHKERKQLRLFKHIFTQLTFDIKA